MTVFRSSGRDLHAVQPLWFVILTTIYGMLFAGLGAIIAARLAPRLLTRDPRHPPGSVPP